MYVEPNFKSKKALKEAIAAGQVVTVYNPGPGDVPLNGTVGVEGPHSPEPHKWYGSATIANGVVVKVK